jgi:hypothetical protein
MSLMIIKTINDEDILWRRRHCYQGPNSGATR